MNLKFKDKSTGQSNERRLSKAGEKNCCSRSTMRREMENYIRTHESTVRSASAYGEYFNWNRRRNYMRRRFCDHYYGHDA